MTRTIPARKRAVLLALLGVTVVVSVPLSIGLLADITPTPLLHWATINGYTTMAKLLLPKATEVDLRNEYGGTLLHQAANRDIAELLLAKGAKLYGRDKYGWSPLHWAASENRDDVVEFLLARGAKVNARNKFHETPLHWAALGGYLRIAELLSAKGAEVSASTIYDETPLHWAARGGQTDVAQLLLAKGAQVNARTVYGETPLHETAFFGQLATAEYLVANGAEINAKTYRDPDKLNLDKVLALYGFERKERASVERIGNVRLEQAQAALDHSTVALAIADFLVARGSDFMLQAYVKRKGVDRVLTCRIN